MRLLLLVLLAATCHAQTLKWTFELPDILPGSTHLDENKIRCDAVGNTAFMNTFLLENHTRATSLSWISAAGKPLMNDTLHDKTKLAIIHVSRTELVIFFSQGLGAPVLRKYYFKNGVVASKDTEMLGASSLPGRNSAVDHVKNFVIVAEEDDAGFPIRLRRYNLR